ncbi:MAG: HU family DNA-binding protein [Paludibacteraceae bacterium]|nr:HU family DNA-binding protein [Paludibacteraceae bacterium]
MNHKELQAALAEKTGMSQKQCQAILDVFVDVMRKSVVEGESTQMLDLGAFDVREKEQKVMFNPLTGKRSLIPPKLVVGFKASATTKNQIK